MQYKINMSYDFIAFNPITRCNIQKSSPSPILLLVRDPTRSPLTHGITRLSWHTIRHVSTSPLGKEYSTNFLPSSAEESQLEVWNKARLKPVPFNKGNTIKIGSNYL